MIGQSPPMRRAHAHVDGEAAESPAWAIEIRRARKGMGKSQGAYGDLIGVSQQMVSDCEKGIAEPSRETIRALIENGEARPGPFLSLIGVTPDALTSPDDYSEARRSLFQVFFARLRRLYSMLDVAIETDDLAWRAHELWTRALLLNEPPTLRERLDVAINEERQRLKRAEK